jgi:hypothetical protein
VAGSAMLAPLVPSVHGPLSQLDGRILPKKLTLNSLTREGVVIDYENHVSTDQRGSPQTEERLVRNAGLAPPTPFLALA